MTDPYCLKNVQIGLVAIGLQLTEVTPHPDGKAASRSICSPMMGGGVSNIERGGNTLHRRGGRGDFQEDGRWMPDEF